MQSEGEWIAAALLPDGVGSLVPPVFEAYARVFHPAVRYDGDDDVEVSWAEVAAVNGTLDHPRMQWAAVTGGWEYLGTDCQPPTWDDAPAEGHLPAEVAARLAVVLTAHTTTPGICLFGVWAAFGFGVPGPTLALPRDRDVTLVRGTVADAARNLAPEPQEQSANLWWPGNRAWCVATDIDLRSTYVGGSRACVDALLDVPDLEVWAVDPADPVGLRDDDVNPVPPGGP